MPRHIKIQWRHENPSPIPLPIRWGEGKSFATEIRQLPSPDALPEHPSASPAVPVPDGSGGGEGEGMI